MEEKKEIWIDIKGYEGYYQVSNSGKIKSLTRLNSLGATVNERILKPFISGKYNKVVLCKDGKSTYIFIHHIVVDNFNIGKRNGMKQVVDHINNNKFDNRPENLQVVSNRLNTSKNKRGKTSRYTGIALTKSGRWTAKIRIRGNPKCLGVFDTEIEAHNKYQEALLQITNQ